MPKSIFKLFIAFLIVILTSCAKRGSLSGGDKDTIAPVLKASLPKNLSTGFKGNEIKLVFDEYVKLKNLNKQLIISPPMKNKPEVLPSNASKTITIKIKDTLQPNTTYSFNFGQSIEDNNEGNPYLQFKYVFSTGTFIDSLSLKVKVKDALEKKVDTNVSVMLYEVNDTFNDSTIYKKVPNYISNTLEDSGIITLDNLKKGNYLLIALKDNGNNIFNPNIDKIGFQKEYISLPNDTVFEVDLFKEKVPFKAINATQFSKNRLFLGYEGKVKNTKITLKNGEEIVPAWVTKMPKKDSLQIWFNPLKADSLFVDVQNENFKKQFIVKIKDKKLDTLALSPKFNGNLPLRAKFAVNSSIPLVKFDKSKMTIFNKDSVTVPFEYNYDEMEQSLSFDFNKEPLEKYTVLLLPGALVDFNKKENDSLKYKVYTNNTSDYGNLKVILEHVKQFPVIVQLTDKEGALKASEYLESDSKIEFLSLEPSLYSLRVIYDDNKNGEWDTGSFLDKRQPEEVIYSQKDIDVRANWDVEQPFDLKITD